LQQDDEFYAQVHLRADANIVVSTNSVSKTFAGKAGINRVSMPLQVGSGIRVQVVSDVLKVPTGFEVFPDIPFRSSLVGPRNHDRHQLGSFLYLHR